MAQQNNNIEKDIKRLIIEGSTKDIANYWKKFAKDVIEEVDTELSTKVKIEDLQKQSQIFLQRIDEIDLLAQRFNASWFSKSLGSINENAQLETIQTRLQYAAAFSYSRYIHSILGLPLAKAIVVFDANKDTSTGDIFTKEIYLSDLIRSSSYSLKFLITDLNNLKSSTTKKEGDKIISRKFKTLENQLIKEYEKKDDQKQIKKHIQNVKKAYQYIITYSQAEKKNGRLYVRLPKKKGLKSYEPGDWGTYTFLNYGDLKEAYAAALIESHIQDINGTKDLLCQAAEGLAKDDDGGFLAKVFFENYVTQVDNKGALLGEDIIAHHRNMQYAVKSTNAHLPSLNQYIDFAKDVCSNKITSERMIIEMADSWEKIDEKTGRKKGQRNRELTEIEAEEVKTLFTQAVEQS